MVLNVVEQHGVVAIAQGEDGDFFATQHFFDDDLTPGFFAEFVLIHDPDHGVFGLFNRLGNRHALASGQAISLDHDRRPDLIQIGQRVD